MMKLTDEVLYLLLATLRNYKFDIMIMIIDQAAIHFQLLSI